MSKKYGEIRSTYNDDVVPVPGENASSLGARGPANGSMINDSEPAAGIRTPFNAIQVPTPGQEETPGDVISTTVKRVDVAEVSGNEKPSFMDVKGSGTVAGGF